MALRKARLNSHTTVGVELAFTHQFDFRTQRGRDTDMVRAEIRDKKRFLGHPLLAGLIAATISLFVIGPRLWILIHPRAGSVEWDRGLTFLSQAANPLQSGVEVVMRWRILPALVAHYLGLTGDLPFLIPWLGVAAMVLYWAKWLASLDNDWRFILGGCLVLTSSSGFIIPTHWLGVNDAWVWLALFVVGTAPNNLALVFACLLAPWVDERFIIGAPLAFYAGSQFRNEPLLSRKTASFWISLAVYPLVRLLLSAYLGIHTEGAHLARLGPEALIGLKYGYLGWWMGLRIAWIPIVFFLYHQRSWAFIGLFVLTALVTILLTEDQSRSSAIVLPLALLGLASLKRYSPFGKPHLVLALGLIGCLLPVTRVSDNMIVMYDPLPIEFYRLLR